MICQHDEIDPDVCPARGYHGHVCALDDTHDGLHNCVCGVRWREL